jgi:hypothetical protein
MTAKRVLTADGNFIPFNQVKKEIETKKTVELEDEVPVATEEVVAPVYIKLNGDETASELKAHLDSVKVKYPKTANKEMLINLLKPFFMPTVDDEETVL